ncbi:hypothetical protein L7F22_052176 [Adiantum nelumboides]|nr:hypothetical protein [Adiantum nelumboides]
MFYNKNITLRHLSYSCCSKLIISLVLLLVYNKYEPFVHDACIAVSIDSDVWYFDSGATKHITSHHDMFTSLEAVLNGNTVTCANNASYPIKGVEKIVLNTANGNSFTLLDALYVPGIRDMFTSLEAIPNRNTVTCANNASYPIKGVGKIVLNTANGNSFTLLDALYVPMIKKNLLSIFALENTYTS